MRRYDVIYGHIWYDFVNDLPDAFDDTCKFISCADDTQLLVFDDNLEGLKQKVIKVINVAQNWYERNGMKNNSSKSEILVVSTKKRIQDGKKSKKNLMSGNPVIKSGNPVMPNPATLSLL